MGDSAAIPQGARWFETRDWALATLRDVLTQDE
jgi:hypothetical protein